MLWFIGILILVCGLILSEDDDNSSHGTPLPIET